MLNPCLLLPHGPARPEGFQGKVLSALCVGLLVAPCAVEAQWQPNGTLVCPDSSCSSPSNAHVASDGLGGAFIAWNRGRSIFVQRLTGQGVPAPGWPDSGLRVASGQGARGVSALIAEGLDGVFVVWLDHRDVAFTGPDIYAARVTGDGQLAPGWLENGTPVCTLPDDQAFVDVAGDESGGMYAVWSDRRNGTHYEVYALRFLQDGSIAPGWSQNGNRVTQFESRKGIAHVVPDGGGGVIVGWSDGRNDPIGDVYATRLGSDGAVDPAWNSDGTMVLEGPESQGVDEMVSDGQGGAYLASVSLLGFEEQTRDYYLSRISGSGTPAPGWPATGVPLCIAPQGQWALRMATDGLGGIVASWQDLRDFNDDAYAVRILPDGTRAPGWPENGRPIVGPNPWSETPYAIATDGAGGAYFAVSWVTGAYRTSVQHLNSGGAIASGFGPGGWLMGVGSPEDIAADGQGGAIAVWSYDFLYAQKLVPDGPVATTLALASSEATPDHVRLTWHGDGAAALFASVERREEHSSWTPLGTASTDGADRLQFEDRSVLAGTRYAYRLVWSEAGASHTTGEVWIEVPVALEFALHGFQPNPARTGVASVAFTLPDAAPARLEVLDIAGRRVAHYDAGALGAGRHVLRIGIPAAPGVYLIRLRRDSESRVVRGVLTR